MRIGAILGCALLAILFQAGMGQARDQIGHKDAVVIDPQKSYIFYRTNERLDVRFLREVEAAQRSVWEAERDRRFERARGQYERRRAEYASAAARCRGVRAPCLNMERPVPVTRGNFTIPPPELDNFVQVRRGPQFVRDEPNFAYLIAVDPGTYVIYGQIVGNGSVNVGTCLCMGSVRFAAPAGQIVDIGTLRFPRAEAGAATAGFGSRRLYSVELVPPGPALPLPERLARLPVVRAELRAADKMPNYFGIEIDRLPAVPGVLGYERDRVIDVATGRPVEELGAN